MGFPNMVFILEYIAASLSTGRFKKGYAFKSCNSEGQEKSLWELSITGVFGHWRDRARFLTFTDVIVAPQSTTWIYSWWERSNFMALPTRREL
jgi:hypothetical protein